MLYFTPDNVEHRIEELIQVRINLFFCLFGGFLVGVFFGGFGGVLLLLVLLALFVFFCILSGFV